MLMNRSANWLLSALLVISTPVSAQLLDGCPSELITEKFQEFGKTGKMPPDLGQWLGNEDAQYIEPGAVFDNVDYVGICWVSAWLIHTDDGVVLVDTLYGPFAEQLLENIARVDVDPADIKYVLMTHGHFDHTGGAAIVKAQLPNAQFVMTKAGWDEAAANAVASRLGRRAWDMVEPEIVIEDGESIELGGNTFTAFSTPGHTWGTTSYTYDVVDDGNTYRSVTIGGLGLNAIEGASQVETYIESIDKISARVNDPEQPVLVHLSTHGFSNNLPENREKLAAQKPGEQNVFVDPEALKDQISKLRQGAVERLELEKSK